MFNDIINKIRDILRLETIIGKDSINYCITFLVIRLLDKPLCQKLSLDEKYTFNNLFNDGNVNKNLLYEKIYNPGTQDFLILHLVSKLNMNFLRGFKVKSSENLYNILNILKDLNINEIKDQYDLIGTIYELHLKTGTNNGRDLGQYFTNRLVIEYMVKMVNPLPTDLICDPAMGTGGFLTICVKHLNKYNINWSTHKNNIYGFDIDEEITNLATLNLLLETGEKFDNLYHQNALTFNIQNKFDIILANEPMGLKMDYKLCSDKIKQLNIKTKLCESLFVQLIMQLLNSNGKACVVVPEGFLFGVKQLNVRKYLVENFNLNKIISLDGKFFINTNVKTSILYFINNGKTKNVEIWNLNSNLKDKFITNLTYEQICQNNYDLYYYHYQCNLLYRYPNVNYYKLSDIFYLFSGTFNASEMDNNGPYPFYSGKANNPVGYHSTYNVEYPEYLILVKGGGSGKGKYGNNIGLGKTFYVKGKAACSNGTIILIPKCNINLIYVYYYLLNIKNYIMDLATYTTGLGTIRKSEIEKIEIPIPSEEKQEIIINKIKILNDEIKQIKNKITESKQQLNNVFNKFATS